MVVAGDTFEADLPLLLGIAPQNGNGYFIGFRPGYIYWDRVPDYLGGVLDSSLLAEVISHEIGHMIGLAHDGTSTLEYYGGHGDGPTSWAPIMGGPAPGLAVGRNVTQWAAGGYPDANNLEPDLELLTTLAYLSIPPRTYRLDDVGDDIAAASTLSLPASGVLAEPGDVDVYRLPLVREAHIEVTPFRAGGLTDGGNLDVAFDVIDASGALVATADPQKLTTAALTVELPLEPHYLRVRASHDPDNYPLYGSLGQYTITATLRSVSLTEFSEPMPTDQLTAGRTVPVKFGVTGPVAGARVRLDPAGTNGGEPLAETACTPRRNGSLHCLLRVPRELDDGQYMITVEIQDMDGNWFAPLAAGTNPITVNVR
jgi:hypothetical protein